MGWTRGGPAGQQRATKDVRRERDRQDHARPPSLGKEFRLYTRKIYSKKYISAFTFGFNVNYVQYTKFTPDKEMGRTYQSKQFNPQNIHKLVDFQLLLTPKAGWVGGKERTYLRLQSNSILLTSFFCPKHTLHISFCLTWLYLSVYIATGLWVCSVFCSSSLYNTTIECRLCLNFRPATADAHLAHLSRLAALQPLHHHYHGTLPLATSSRQPQGPQQETVNRVGAHSNTYIFHFSPNQEYCSLTLALTTESQCQPRKLEDVIPNKNALTSDTNHTLGVPRSSAFLMDLHMNSEILTIPTGSMIHKTKTQNSGKHYIHNYSSITKDINQEDQPNEEMDGTKFGGSFHALSSQNPDVSFSLHISVFTNQEVPVFRVFIRCFLHKPDLLSHGQHD